MASTGAAGVGADQSLGLSWGGSGAAGSDGTDGACGIGGGVMVGGTQVSSRRPGLDGLEGGPPGLLPAWRGASRRVVFVTCWARQASPGFPAVSTLASSRPPSRPTFLKNRLRLCALLGVRLVPERVLDCRGGHDRGGEERRGEPGHPARREQGTSADQGGPVDAHEQVRVLLHRGWGRHGVEQLGGALGPRGGLRSARRR